MMVCLTSFLLVEFIIQGWREKVNGMEGTFTVCLQPLQFQGFCSQIVQKILANPMLTSALAYAII